MKTIKKIGDILQIYANFQQFDLAAVDAFDYNRFTRIVMVFSNGISVGSIEEVDVTQWGTLKANFGSQFLKFSWASFKQACITNPTAVDQEIQVNFSVNTYIRN